MRVWLGLLVLVTGTTLAMLYFQTPPEPAAIEQIVLAQLAENAVAASSVASGAGGGTVTGGNPARSAPAPWERRTIVVASRHAPEGNWQTVIEAGDAAERLSGAGLTRALQAELQRVGCYQGEIDGDWGPMSKRAMGDFTARVNASLPVQSPDDILLRMVRAFEGQACGACRSGERANEHGQCVPATVLAGRSGDSAAAGRRGVEPLPGRMSVGGPVNADADNRSLTRYEADVAASEPSPKPRRTKRRSRVADRSSPPPQYRSRRREQRHWTETIFEQISRR